jgi:hypothetical protein
MTVAAEGKEIMPLDESRKQRLRDILRDPDFEAGAIEAFKRGHPERLMVWWQLHRDKPPSAPMHALILDLLMKGTCRKPGRPKGSFSAALSKPLQEKLALWIYVLRTQEGMTLEEACRFINEHGGTPIPSASTIQAYWKKSRYRKILRLDVPRQKKLR